MATIASLRRITAPKLAELLLAADPTMPDSSPIAVVDVRDDDYIGGHIRGALNYPSRSLDATLPTLMRKLADKDTVVFHCALSQQRGPGAALKYVREKEAAAAKAAKKASAGAEDGEVDAAAAKKEQTVYVLDQGFVGWQEKYGADVRLTEGYRKELWEDGYWG